MTPTCRRAVSSSTQYSARRGACGHSGAVCASRESGEFRRNDCQKSSGLSSAESRHDLEVRSWILGMQRLSACAQGAKRSDSKASMSAFGWLHQEGGAWQCGAVSRSASASKHVQGRSASESGPCLLLAAARVSSITRHRAAVLRVMQGEARAARAGEAFVRVVCCCAVGCACASGSGVHHSGIAQLFTHQVCFRDPPIAHYFLLTQDFFEVEGEIPLHPLSLSETTALHYDSFCEDFA